MYPKLPGWWKYISQTFALFLTLNPMQFGSIVHSHPHNTQAGIHRWDGWSFKDTLVDGESLAHKGCPLLPSRTLKDGSDIAWPDRANNNSKDVNCISSILI